MRCVVFSRRISLSVFLTIKREPSPIGRNCAWPSKTISSVGSVATRMPGGLSGDSTSSSGSISSSSGSSCLTFFGTLVVGFHGPLTARASYQESAPAYR